MNRNHNFCAGPAALPETVLVRARDELLNYNHTGMSVMEVSHRSPGYMVVAKQAVADFKELMAIPDNYKILYMQGGATHQFSCIPWNLLGKNKKADFIDTGIWSQKAIKEARRFDGVDVHIAASSEMDGYKSVPDQSDLDIRQDAAFVHYTPNETIGGVEFDYVPDSGAVPLIADMSSNILSQSLDVSKFGIIYAGAQKNIGPAGLTWVIVREDLLGQAHPSIPALMNYDSVLKQDSMLNTPPTFSLYLCGLVFQWLKEQGGVAAVAKRNAQKAKLLYQTIDCSGFYNNNVRKDCRSQMNVTFSLNNEELESVFIEEGEKLGLYNLKGHRSVGGMRASIYNAVSLESVTALTQFMADFEKKYG